MTRISFDKNFRKIFDSHIVRDLILLTQIFHPVQEENDVEGNDIYGMYSNPFEIEKGFK